MRIHRTRAKGRPEPDPIAGRAAHRFADAKRCLTPYAFICQAWTKEPKRFRLDPSHHIRGPLHRERPTEMPA
ncbi:hypothetical protein BV511_00680 [Methylorubrum extorquens]|nr:hypothetical protein BV511_00680 [Methylorubrum extorquens]ARO55129.1 hypothetical protein B2G69_14050 [Methylorubrum zatmanii]